MNILKVGTNIRMLQTEKLLGEYLYKDARVIDIGAGNGYISKYLMRRFGCRMHCADIIDYKECDLPFTLIKNNRLPFKKDAFDIAIMNEVLHHMPYKTQIVILKEATRIANKLIIIDTERTIVAMVLDTITSKIQSLSMPMPYTHGRSSDWKILFSKIGLKFEERRVISPRYYPIKHLFFVVYRNK